MEINDQQNHEDEEKQSKQTALPSDSVITKDEEVRERNKNLGGNPISKHLRLWIDQLNIHYPANKAIISHRAKVCSSYSCSSWHNCSLPTFRQF